MPDLIPLKLRQLIPKLRNSVVTPALEMRKVLLARRAEDMGTRTLDNVPPDDE